MYIAGTTRSGDFPLTGSAYAAERWGDQDAFIVKLDPNSSSLAYSSYLGGETIDEGRAVAVTPAGIVYFAGSTLSGQFPLAGLSYRDQLAGAVDIFLCQMDLTKSGTSSLLYATYIGGSGVEELRKIALDGQGKVLLTGYTLSTDFPVTGDAFQSSNKGGGDVFLMRFDPAAPPSAAVLYSTYLGGRGGDVAYDIAADAGSKVYLTGYTLSQDFPVTGDAVQLNWGGGIDVFVIALDLSKPGAGALVFGSYLGLDGVHVGYGVAASANGTIYAAGYTGIHNIQTTSGAVQPGFAGGLSDGFLVVIGPQ
jgi:hypothetical protein